MFLPLAVWGFPKPNFKAHEYWLCKACCCNSTYRLRYWNLWLQRYSAFELSVATVLTVYGIETVAIRVYSVMKNLKVATVLTVYGIETAGVRPAFKFFMMRCNSTYRLRYWNSSNAAVRIRRHMVATVLTVYGIETRCNFWCIKRKANYSCNSTYRLRYWNWTYVTPSTSNPGVATVLTVYGIETRYKVL